MGGLLTAGNYSLSSRTGSLRSGPAWSDWEEDPPPNCRWPTSPCPLTGQNEGWFPVSWEGTDIPHEGSALLTQFPPQAHCCHLGDCSIGTLRDTHVQSIADGNSMFNFQRPASLCFIAATVFYLPSSSVECPYFHILFVICYFHFLFFFSTVAIIMVGSDIMVKMCIS